MQDVIHALKQIRNARIQEIVRVGNDAYFHADFKLHSWSVIAHLLALAGFAR